MRKLKLGLILAACFSAGAQATVIDFDVLSHDGVGETDGGYFEGFKKIGNQYVEEGFVIQDLEGANLGLFGTSANWYYGETVLTNFMDDGLTSLTKLDGGTFDLLSIDLTELFGNDFGWVVVEFIRDGGHSQVFSLDEQIGAETFVFDSGFTAVTEVTWRNHYGYHSFDDIVIDNFSSDVSEPGTAMLAIGLLGLGLVRRKQTSKLG